MLSMTPTNATAGATGAPILFDGLDHDPLLTVLVVAAGTAGLVLTSGHVVHYALREAGVDRTDDESDADTGRVIGKIENLLVLGLMLLQAYTALGVIFAAKSLVRKSDIDSADTSYYLTGTIANFTWSVAVGILLHVVLWGLIRFGVGIHVLLEVGAGFG